MWTPNCEAQLAAAREEILRIEKVAKREACEMCSRWLEHRGMGLVHNLREISEEMRKLVD